MAIVKCKLTSAGRRFVVKVVNQKLHKDIPCAPLLEKKSKSGGRSNNGRITTRHIGGGHKQYYCLVDFRRNKDGIPTIVERIEYDPSHTTHIALLKYADSKRRYIIVPKGVAAGDQLISGVGTPIRADNSISLRSIPVDSTVRGIELKPGKDTQITRSIGVSAQLVAHKDTHVTLCLRSGEMRKALAECHTILSEVSNSEHSLRSLGRADATRWRGVRPIVRSVAMNSVDHSHGDGEGRTSAGRHPVSPWSLQTRGKKTRSSKRTDNVIVRRRE